MNPLPYLTPIEPMLALAQAIFRTAARYHPHASNPAKLAKTIAKQWGVETDFVLDDLANLVAELWDLEPPPQAKP